MKQENKFFQNAKWIIGCKIIQSLIQLVIGMVTARYLGPSDYGLINYAASVTAFLIPFMQLGLQSTLVQEYILAPEKSSEILGTSMVMTGVSALLSIMGVIGFSLVANWGEPATILVCTLYGLTLLCQAMEMIQYWFQAKMLSKYSALAMLVAYLVISAYKVYLLVSGKSVYWFAVSHALEYGMSGVLMFVVQRRMDGGKLCFSWKLAKNLFSRSKYYILAAMMATVFHNTDHIMLKLISGNAENGFYTTAFTCTSIANFLYYGLADAVRPVILESRKQSYYTFEENTVRFYTVILWISILQSMVSVILAEPIIEILYGQDYLPAVSVFRVLVLQLVFANAGIVRNIWILGTEQHNVLWKVNLCGVGANVVLNAFMIPVWGASGAAFASVLTQCVINVIVGFLMPELRRNNQLMLRGLNPQCLTEWLSQHMLNNSRGSR